MKLLKLFTNELIKNAEIIIKIDNSDPVENLRFTISGTITRFCEEVEDNNVVTLVPNGGKDGTGNDRS